MLIILFFQEAERIYTPTKSDNDDAAEATQPAMEKVTTVKKAYCYVGPKYRRKREEEEERKRREAEDGGRRKVNGGGVGSASSERVCFS